MMNLLPYFIAWAALAIVVLILALMRRQIAIREDDSLHIGTGEAALVTEQVQTAKKLESIDKWGKLLTIVIGCVRRSSWQRLGAPYVGRSVTDGVREIVSVFR